MCTENLKSLLFINNGYPTQANPNHSSYAETIADCIKRSGCDITLLVLRFNKKISTSYKLLKYLVFWIKLFFLNLNKYDIIYVNHAPFAWPLFWNLTFKRNRKKVFVHWHGDDAIIQSKFLRYSRKIVKNNTDEDCIQIVPSQYFKIILVRELSYQSNKVMVSPSGGVDVSVFQCSSNDNNDVFDIGFASGMSDGKGADLIMALIDNAETIEKTINKSISFKIIDYGSDVSKYHNRLSEHKYVKLISPMPKSEMPDFYSNIDILLMPSIRKSESLGLVVLEAMSCGKPVVTFKQFAFPEFVISSISGEMVNYSSLIEENVNGFMNAISQICTNYRIYNPREIVKNRYSKEYVIEQYKNMFGC